MDTWLAAHYGLQLHEVPPGVPTGMNKYLYKFIKGSARKTRELMKDFEKSQKRGQPKQVSPPAEQKQPKKEHGSMGGGVTWQISPAKFDGMYLSKKNTTLSYVAKLIK